MKTTTTIRFFTKTAMKKIKLIALAVIFLAACKKESDEINPSSNDQTESGLNVTAQKAKVTRPFSLNLSTTADTSASPTPCTGDLTGFATPGQFLHGTASHCGKVDATQSRLQDVNCNLSFTTAILTTSIAGQLAAANGDLIYYTGNDEINVYNLLTGSGPTGTITGVWSITGGTGRFAGATGSFTINGPVYFATTSFSFTGNGTITY